RYHGADSGAWAGRCGSAFDESGWERYRTGGERFGDFGGGAFGVRRPLRFLAYKLDLDERQVTELAKILSDLKTERAQAEVDARRTMAAFAEAVAGEKFDESRAAEAGSLRVGSAERLRDAVVRALGRIHAVLEADQRERLAYLIRTGALMI
ncbi:MAG: Spy/CpxP family protein refolding chaperone, partial [Candidatus Binatia bacterium]